MRAKIGAAFAFDLEFHEPRVSYPHVTAPALTRTINESPAISMPNVYIELRVSRYEGRQWSDLPLLVMRTFATCGLWPERRAASTASRCVVYGPPVIV